MRIKDIAALEIVRDVLAPGAKIRHRVRVRKGARLKGRQGNKQYLSTDANTLAPQKWESGLITVESEQLVADLSHLGVQPRDRRNRLWPKKLPQKHWAAYVKGIFDADGEICYEPSGPTIVFTNPSRNFLYELAGALKQQTQIPIEHPHVSPKDKTMYELVIRGDGAIAINDWMSEPGIGLVRNNIGSAHQEAAD